MLRSLSPVSLVLVSFALGCVGAVEGGGSMPAGTPGAGGAVAPGGMGGSSPPAARSPVVPPRSGLRRLSRAELNLTLRDLLGDESHAALRRLPEENVEIRFAFDNDAHANAEVSSAYLEAVEGMVTDLVEAALRNPAQRAKMVPCTPASPGDAVCMKTFVADFGRRALRRPLLPEEQMLYEGFLKFGMESGDFFRGVGGAVRAMLTGPEFVFRVEQGTPVGPGRIKLTPHELATRLSYTLLGTAPDRALLDEATRGTLNTTAGVRAAAERMLADPRAKARIQHFAAYWLGYQGNLAPELAAAMLEETNTLLDEVVFGARRDFRDLFLTDKTFIGDALRKHYTELGAPAAGKPAWVSYGTSGRMGILSHASVLSGFKTGDDTSITKRGIFVRLRLLCDPVPELPDNVAIDVTAAATQCKTGPDGFYVKSHQGAACNACHKHLDPIGFGLERYNVRGQLRMHDDGKPNCPIDARGTVTLPAGERAFSGPGQLADVIVGSGKLERCVVKHLYRFATGFAESEADEPAIDELMGRFEGKRDFAALMVALVSSPTFAQGRTETGGTP